MSRLCLMPYLNGSVLFLFVLALFNPEQSLAEDGVAYAIYSPCTGYHVSPSPHQVGEMAAAATRALFPECKPYQCTNPTEFVRAFQTSTGGWAIDVKSLCGPVYTYGLEKLSDPKDNGCPAVPAGNPCDAASGNKFEVETDYEGAGPFPLIFRRFYNSKLGPYYPANLGFGWTSNLHAHLAVYVSPEYNFYSVTARRPNGRSFIYRFVDGVWTPDADIAERLEQTSTGWILTLRDGTVESYSNTGRLLSFARAGRIQTLGYDSAGRVTTVTDSFGRQLTLAYDAGGKLASLTDPAGRQTTYSRAVFSLGRDSIGRVNYPDGTAKVYTYTDKGMFLLLSGISYVETNGTTQRHATFQYDSNPLYSRAISTEHAATENPVPQGRFTLTYDSSIQTTITDAAGTKEILTFSNNLGTKQLLSKLNLADGKSSTQSYDTNNNLTCRRNEEGQVTTYTYNAHNQRTSMTEGLTGDCTNPVTTAATRTKTYQYLSPTLDFPTVTESPSVYSGGVARTSITYDGNNNPTQITQSGFTFAGQAVSRTTRLTYNDVAQVTSIDGPRTDVSDVTTLAYYDCATGSECGQLRSITNALGHTTLFESYDPNGRPLAISDPNGMRTTYVYDARGRAVTVTQTPAAGSARITRYVYNAAGKVTAVTFPDGRTVAYTYDAALNLKKITDALGNRVEYAYDAKDNRVSEKTFDASGTLVASIQTAYDLRNFPSAIVSGGNMTDLSHDALGNVVQSTDPNNNPPTRHAYDPLNRLTRTVDALSGQTGYGYTPHDRPASVQAPNGAATRYAYDDLGNVLQEISPDRGTTGYSYDAAGNVLAQTDARGIIPSYGYDALNRLLSVSYLDTSENVGYTYDTCATGRLCSVQDATGTTQYTYDGFGNIASQSYTVFGQTYLTRYTYDAGDRISSILYPDGRTVSYTRDTLGRVSAVTTTPSGGSAQTIVSARTYRANGLLATQSFGNGLAETRSYDTAARLTAQSLGSLDSTQYTYDANGNLIDKTKSTNPPLSSNPELLAAYDFDGQYFDLAGRGHDGRANGSVAFVPGVAGQALDFNGVANTYLDLGPFDELEGLTSYTVAAWVNLKTTAVQWQHLFGKATYWATGDVGFHCNNASCGMYVGAGIRTETSLTGLTNQWHHWVGTYENGTIRFYLDGVLKKQTTSATQSLGVNAFTFKIGTDNEGQGPAQFQIDGLKIYRGALTQAQIAALMQAPTPGTQTYRYDPLDRLTQAGTATYGYDPNGNRISDVRGPYAYQSATNRMTASPEGTEQLDAAGNTIADGIGRTYSYHPSGTLREVQWQGNAVGRYGYDFRRLRTVKTTTSGTTIFHYDLNGNLVAETTSNGTPIRSYVWDDTVPLAQLFGTQLTYLHTDHLGTPVLGTDTAARIVWRAGNEAFGFSSPQEDPDGDGVITIVNLMFPGQYRDGESGLFYNWNRYYDPKTGRYITSDPIGLDGGLNPYAYVGNNPLRWTDPTGLLAPLLAPVVVEGIVNTVGIAIALLVPGNSNVIPFPGGSAATPTAPSAQNPGSQCPPDDPCKKTYETLQKWWDVLSKSTPTPGNAAVDARTKSQFNDTVDQYNAVCVPKGHPEWTKKFTNLPTLGPR